MKDLVQIIKEGNISNVERKYREFTQMCTGYNVNIEEVRVRKTPRNNWAVYVDGKRKFTASSNILDSAVVETYQIKLYEE